MKKIKSYGRYCFNINETGEITKMFENLADDFVGECL
jgi:hypothetical protein